MHIWTRQIGMQLTVSLPCRRQCFPPWASSLMKANCLHPVTGTDWRFLCCPCMLHAKVSLYKHFSLCQMGDSHYQQSPLPAPDRRVVDANMPQRTANTFRCWLQPQGWLQPQDQWLDLDSTWSRDHYLACSLACFFKYAASV